MMRLDRYTGLASIVGLFAAVVMVGCSEPTIDSTKSSASVSETAIKQIESNPNIPADQKAAAIARLKSRPVPGQVATQ